ncbi:hypothetical protein PVL29_015060 [Vitis rotundifolia]|uniref:Disease resistance protein n=1 Tax=Vitis rotundifolia TaxID=103349 RepID=A0AA39DIE4_VITRO|nr:hypothetical protein PVL29_015060 [Vitis rotundifolia]
MAESSVVFAVKRLGDLLIEEAVFLQGVSNKVAEIQTELKQMQCFLRDADARQDEDEMIRNWDVIETFAFRAALRRRSCLRIGFKRLACIFSEGRELHRVGTQIDAIKGRISSLTASLQTYNIRAIGGGERSGSRNERRRLLRRSYSHVVDEDTVGQLVKPDEKCSVVSLCGMGGLGKTTLAKKVYHHGDVRRHFDCFAWICISQQFNTRSVVQGILMKLATGSEKERETLEKMKEKRCLVILDDLWEIDDWKSLRPAFPLHETGRGTVALHVDPHGFIYQPKYLTEEDSWELLQSKAFPRHDDNNGKR